MNLIIYFLSAAFALMALALLFAYRRTRHSGFLLMGLTYAGAAALALIKMHWWPLAGGFAILWVFKLLGLEPGAPKDER